MWTSTMATGSGSQLSVCFCPRTCSRSFIVCNAKGLFPNSLRNHLLLPTQSLWDHLTLIPFIQLDWIVDYPYILMRYSEQSELSRLKTNHICFTIHTKPERSQLTEAKQERLLIAPTYFSIWEQTVVAEKLCELLTGFFYWKEMCGKSSGTNRSLYMSKPGPGEVGY